VVISHEVERNDPLTPDASSDIKQRIDDG